MAATMVLSSSLTAFAAPETMPDGTIFDAEYYAQTNPDVVAILETDKNVLYQHYLNYGKAEGRQAYDEAQKTNSQSVLDDIFAETYKGYSDTMLARYQGASLTLEQQKILSTAKQVYNDALWEIWYVNLTPEERQRFNDTHELNFWTGTDYETTLPQCEWFQQLSRSEQEFEVLMAKASRFDRMPRVYETEGQWRDRIESEIRNTALNPRVNIDYSWYDPEKPFDYEKEFEKVRKAIANSSDPDVIRFWSK